MASMYSKTWVNLVDLLVTILLRLRDALRWFLSSTFRIPDSIIHFRPFAPTGQQTCTSFPSIILFLAPVSALPQIVSHLAGKAKGRKKETSDFFFSHCTN